jgi:membrane-bound lytic murein transglycosylase B
MGKIFTVFFLFWVSMSSALADNQQSFDDWLKDLRVEALYKGIRPATLDAALTGIQPIPRVIELDRKQPEFTLTFAQYLERVVPVSRQNKARDRFKTNQQLLEEIGNKYGVQPRFIVALWGIETDFGRVTGGFDVISALASLAYDGRRSAFFRKELFHALTIIDQGHVSADNMKGSWAGAMGQSQFMPSSFVQYAQDYDGDGRRDIWSTQADVFASAANYLKRVGWRDDITWGRQVQLPTSGKASRDNSMALHDNKTWKGLNDWAALGVTSFDGSALPSRNIQARLVMPDGKDGPAYLAYKNFEAILKWNRSNYFAIAVGTLSDSMR